VGSLANLKERYSFR